MNRRHFLSRSSKIIGASSLISTNALWSAMTQAQGLKTIGEATPFNFVLLQMRAKLMAQQAYQAPQSPLPDDINHLTWETYQQIQHRDERTLWLNDPTLIKAKLFHLGLGFKKPVQIYQVIDNQASELAFDPDLFHYGQSGVNPNTLPENLGFAGFKLFDTHDLARDLVSFIGASYFRAVGPEKQYGLSARGLAIDTVMPSGEEFPDFTAFWLVKPTPESKTIRIYALLDSPSISGAYQFDITLGDEVIDMDICAKLYPRKEIVRMGIGPCTSMYQHGENDRRMAWDWRPEIHDSDGLQIHTGSGEWIWRPLLNPRSIRYNAFQDNNPKGFGLIQRDKNFDHYQEDGVYYNQRPSLWVIPKSSWGEGSIDLVEIPTADENMDNIVAYWTPKEKPQPGQEYTYEYQLQWVAVAPHSPLAICVDTFTGTGGQVGQPRTEYSLRFAIDFVGDILQQLPQGANVEAVVSTTYGRIDLVSARPQHEKKGYRAMFDIYPGDMLDQITLRVYLKQDDKLLSETWLYQWTPPPMNERIFY